MKDFDIYEDGYDDLDMAAAPDIDDLLEAAGMNIEQAAEKCDNLISEFDEFVSHLGCTVKDKFNICDKTAESLNRGVIDKDDLELCFALMSVHSDFLFEDEEDDEARVYSYLMLRQETSERIQSLIEQHNAREEYRRLADHISYVEESVGEIDFRLLQRTVYSLGFKGDELENNLRMLTDRILSSKELYRIAPLVYYSALMRNTSKMQNKQDYVPNISRLLRRTDYHIHDNNGKNIPVLNHHVNVMISLAEALCTDKESIWLNMMGFDEICNIMQSELVDWEPIENLRPVETVLRNEMCSVFTHGAADNPFYTTFDEYLDEQIMFEEKYKSTAKKLKEYMSENTAVTEQYEELLRSGNAEKSMPVIINAIKDTGDWLDSIDAGDVPAAYSFIMSCIMERTDERMRTRLAESLTKFTLEHYGR